MLLKCVLQNSWIWKNNSKIQSGSVFGKKTIAVAQNLESLIIAFFYVTRKLIKINLAILKKNPFLIFSFVYHNLQISPIYGLIFNISSITLSIIQFLTTWTRTVEELILYAYPHTPVFKLFFIKFFHFLNTNIIFENMQINEIDVYERITQMSVPER